MYIISILPGWVAYFASIGSTPTFQRDLPPVVLWGHQIFQRDLVHPVGALVIGRATITSTAWVLPGAAPVAMNTSRCASTSPRTFLLGASMGKRLAHPGISTAALLFVGISLLILIRSSDVASGLAQIMNRCCDGGNDNACGGKSPGCVLGSIYPEANNVIGTGPAWGNGDLMIGIDQHRSF